MELNILNPSRVMQFILEAEIWDTDRKYELSKLEATLNFEA